MADFNELQKHQCQLKNVNHLINMKVSLNMMDKDLEVSIRNLSIYAVQ